MGGDYAPGEIVAGAVQAARTGGVHVLLVGDPEQVQAELAKHDAERLPIKVVPSEGVVQEGEPPAQSLRRKPRSSILVATGAVKQGHADACVSMGSTGAAMAAAAVVLGMIEGVDRPAFGGPVIGLAPRTIILDIGANLDCRPEQLLSFAVIGDVFARQLWGIDRPRVGLLSVGAESGKGNRQVREASKLIAKTGLNFIGNVEADDLPQNKADVVVCDGFVGNVVMKLAEGLGNALSDRLRERFESKIPGTGLEEILRDVHEVSAPAETHGGGPLFGVNGVSIVGHGRARADAVERAIGTARLTVETGFISKVNGELAKVRATVSD
jgi:glycerol-3-phosphate acyltransferase PlsX